VPLFYKQTANGGNMKTYSILVLSVVFIFVSINTTLLAQKTIQGDTKPMGSGSVSSWMIVDENDNPVSVGVTFDADALKGLQKPTDEGGMRLTTFPDVVIFETVLNVPDKDGKTAFNHIAIDWNPMGHPPDFYGNPHFDFHFYMNTPEDRAKITCVGDDTLRVYKVPAPEYIPTDYMTAPLTGEGGMGVHYFDPNSSEFHHGFTKTMIYGFYDGIMVFIEPMITKAFLETKPNTTETIKLPKAYPKSNVYYPTAYTVKYDEASKQYTVSLDGMTLRK